jgi:hypothetical protein
MKKTMIICMITLFVFMNIGLSFAMQVPNSSSIACKIQIYGHVNLQNSNRNTSNSQVIAKASNGTLSKYELDKTGNYEISNLADGAYTLYAISKSKGFRDSYPISIVVKDGKSSINRIYFTLPASNQAQHALDGTWPGGKQLVGVVAGSPETLFEGSVILTNGKGYTKKAKVSVINQYFFIGIPDGIYTIKAVSANALYIPDGIVKTITIQNKVCTPNCFDFSYSTTTKINYVNVNREKAALPIGQVYIPQGLRPDGTQAFGWMKGPKDTTFNGHLDILGRYGSYEIPVTDGGFTFKGIANGKYYVTAVSDDESYVMSSAPLMIAVEDGICSPNGLVPEYIVIKKDPELLQNPAETLIPSAVTVSP